MFLRSKKAQSTLEYTVVIAIIVAALIAMQAYIKRGVQGKLKQSTDDIGDQFSPTTSTSNYTTATGNTQVESVHGGVTRTDITRGQQSKTGSEQVGTLEDEPTSD